MTNYKQNRVPATRYRHPQAYVQQMALYVSALADPEREFMLSRIQKALAHAMQHSVTRRELEYLELYFVQGLNYEMIGQRLGINISTICRNVKRGEEKSNRVLSFAREILGQDAT